MIISFDVLAVENFSNAPQISNLENLTMVDEGQEVPVIEGSTRAITPDDYGKIIKVGGTLDPATERGCGGESTCWDMDYGNGTITFRSSNPAVEGGACITFVGPLRSFPGPIGNELTAGDLQADEILSYWTPFIE